MRLAGSRPTWTNLQRKALALADNFRSFAKQAPEPLDVQGRGHCDQAQVLPQGARRVQGQGERKVIVEAALVNLVEQYCRDAAKLRIRLNARQENAVRHHDDAAVLPDLAVQARCVADRRPSCFAQRRGHELRGGASSEPTRNEQQDLPAAPWLTDQGRSHPGRLARARRSDQQGAAMLAQGLEKFREYRINRQDHRQWFAQSFEAVLANLAAGPDSET